MLFGRTNARHFWMQVPPPVLLPLGSQIALQWAIQDKYPFPDKDNLVRVAQFVAVQGGSPLTPKYRIIEQFKNQRPPDFSNPHEPHRVAAEFRLPVYITTNYDNFMIRAVRWVDAQESARNQDFEPRQPREAICKWHLARRSKPECFDLDFDPDEEKPVIFHMKKSLAPVPSMKCGT